ncbi:MAG: tRNA 4-thiouridine(8) synthase ThiI [Deltaproteobacteria bacterium]|nr:tRNA 4-thiouridine(8) synthase ThiI [Deltaproteobacteria bacterium]
MKALCVFSGGLDSMLAAELLRAQGIEVLAITFETPFFPAERARISAASMDLPLKVVDITPLHLEIVKNPKHGYGENMNPCIDCHTLMFSRAGNMLEDEGASFIVTGEVLGQRPKSQKRNALRLIARECGFEGLILRPLSARHLSPTIPEEKGWVDREALMDFSGRSRKPQMALAEKFRIADYPSPAGGCLLTDAGFSRRLKDLLLFRPHPESRELELLKLGRHFRLGPSARLVVGRNKAENQAIQALAKESDLLYRVASFPGPTVLAIGRMDRDQEGLAASIAVSYSDAPDGQGAKVGIYGRGEERIVAGVGQDKGAFTSYIL